MRWPTRHHPNTDDGTEALERFVDDVHARSAAQAETDHHLRTHHPAAAAALDRARAAEAANHQRRLAAAEADAQRRHRPPPPEPAGGPPSYAEIAATVDRNERERLAAWEAAMQRQHHRNHEQLARAERLVTTEHQLRSQPPPPPQRAVRHVVRYRRNPVVTAWLWFRVLLLLGVLYTLALGCLISVAANRLADADADDPTPPTSTPIGVTP